MADADSKHHWAYITIVSLHTAAEQRWRTLSYNVTEAAATRRKLTENPYVTVDIINEMRDTFTMFVSAAQEYIKAVYDDIDNLRNVHGAQENTTIAKQAPRHRQVAA